MTAQVTAPLAECVPPPWASAWGQDEYGFFAEFSIETGPQYWEFVSQRMRWIPPGTFLMGSATDEHERDSSESQHEVTLTRGFWLAESVCRQELWEAVMNEKPSDFRGANLPMENVSYDQVQEFLANVSRMVPALYLSLPTEAEWEYACRAGVKGTPFSFGDDVTTDQANYDGNYPYRGDKRGEFRKQTVAIDALPANRWGLFQMHGNVWEWCQDWYGEYETGAQVDPLGPAGGSDRVVRGGGWINDARLLRSACRGENAPGFRSDDLGFRCSSSVSPEAEQVSASRVEPRDEAPEK